MSAFCRSCGAEIVWAVTDSGKRMPVDAEPFQRSVVVLEGGGNGQPPRASVADAHRSHFATCSFADHHRRAA